MKAALLALLLAQTPCDAPAVETLPEAQRAAACRFLEAREGPPADKATLETIYSRDGFERARERAGGGVSALLAQLEAWLARLFETSGAETYSNATRVVVLCVAALVGLYALLRLVSRRRRVVSAPTALPEVGGVMLASPDVHLARAREALPGDARLAIREALLGLLSFLERSRLARPDRVTTNRELAVELPGRGAPPELAGAVTRLVDWYDAAFYSLAPISEDDARRFIADVTALASGGAGA